MAVQVASLQVHSGVSINSPCLRVLEEDKGVPYSQIFKLQNTADQCHLLYADPRHYQLNADQMSQVSNFCCLLNKTCIASERLSCHAHWVPRLSLYPVDSGGCGHSRVHIVLQVITISGRTIRKEAQASPKYAQAAIDCIEKLLAACPQDEIDRVQDMRKSRNNMKTV